MKEQTRDIVSEIADTIIERIERDYFDGKIEFKPYGIDVIICDAIIEHLDNLIASEVGNV